MAFGIDRLARDVHRRFDAIDQALARLERKVDQMATDADVQAALANFAQTVMQAVTDAQNRTAADIAQLKQQIAQGGTVSQADLDAIANTQSQVLAGIAGIDPANPTPPPTPTA